jgi:peptidoglycan/LPS O-acetylase OafA/YrhL
LIGFVYFILGIHGFEAIGFSLVSLGTGLIIISSYSQTFKSNVISKLLSFLGKISYELYLFHIIILGLIRSIIVPKNLSGLPAIGLLSMFLFCSVLISYLISRFYSEPINRFFRQCLNNRNLKVIN